MKKNSYRTCIITKQKDFKDNLLRICVFNNHLIFDKNNTYQGRGCYIVKNLEKEFITNSKMQKIALNKLKVHKVLLFAEKP